MSTMHPKAMLLAFSGARPMQYSPAPRGQRLCAANDDAPQRVLSSIGVVWRIHTVQGPALCDYTEWTWDAAEAGVDWDALDEDLLRRFIERDY